MSSETFKRTNIVRPLCDEDGTYMADKISLALLKTGGILSSQIVVPEIIGFTPLTRTEHKKVLFTAVAKKNRGDKTEDEASAEFAGNLIMRGEVLSAEHQIVQVKLGAIGLSGAEVGTKGTRSVVIALIDNIENEQDKSTIELLTSESRIIKDEFGYNRTQSAPPTIVVGETISEPAARMMALNLGQLIEPQRLVSFCPYASYDVVPKIG